MNKIILKILIVVSIIIIFLGIFAGKSVKDEVKNRGMPTQNIYIDGTDATAFTEAFVEIGSGLLGVVTIIYRHYRRGMCLGDLWNNSSNNYNYEKMQTAKKQIIRTK